MEKTQQRNRYATITIDILYNKELSPIEKLLIIEISNTLNEDGHCILSNKELGESFNVGERNIRRNLEKLGKMGILTKQFDKKVGRILKITPFRLEF